MLDDVFKALVRPLQASTHNGTALWASSCRSLIWPWCGLWWRTTITLPKTTLWGSSPYPSQACGQVIIKICSVHVPEESSLWHVVCNVCNFSSQGIDMFIYWKQMVPVCPPPHSSSMSKCPAKEFPSKLCPSEWQRPRPRPRAKHNVQLNATESCIFWQQRGFGKEAQNVRRREKSAAASQFHSSDLKWSNLHWATSQRRKEDVIYQRWRSAPALSKWIASGWIMNPWCTVGVFALVSAVCSGKEEHWRFMKHTDMGLVTKFMIVLLMLICRVSLNMSDGVKMYYFILFLSLIWENILTFLHVTLWLKEW